MKENKYYQPDISEFHIGFEYEVFDEENEVCSNKIFPEDFICTGTPTEPDLVELFYSGLKGTRVKYLDRQDIEELGFKNNNEGYEEGLVSRNEFIRIIEEEIISIKTYWNQGGQDRENLIRIFKGIKYNYPYYEIFRGDIKNKTELKKLLKQLGL